MIFNTLLMDIDDTLFDFRKSSFEALQKTFQEVLSRSFSEEDMTRYEVFNNRMWQAFERGEIRKEDIYEERFRLYFASAGIDGSAAEVNRRYLHHLALGRNFMPHCQQCLQILHDRGVKVYIVTNGDTFAQNKRIERCGFSHLFDGVFISEQLHSKKPEKEYFDKVFSLIGEDRRSASLLVGDSLSSDMQGGRNAGIPTCLYTSNFAPDERCDYVIRDLLELPLLLDCPENYRFIPEP